MEVSFFKGGVSIPRPIVSFLIKALIAFVLWKVLYLFLLQPARVPDRQLTRFIGNATAWTLNGFGTAHSYKAVEVPDVDVEDNVAHPTTAMDLQKDGLQTLRVADACNGLELMVLYIGFIVCFPAPLSRKLSFGIAGCLMIMVLNILRCAALVQVFLKYRAYLDFSHHFAFTFVIYGLIFLLWYLFSKNLSLQHDRKAKT